MAKRKITQVVEGDHAKPDTPPPTKRARKIKVPLQSQPTRRNQRLAVPPSPPIQPPRSQDKVVETPVGPQNFPQFMQLPLEIREMMFLESVLPCALEPQYANHLLQYLKSRTEQPSWLDRTQPQPELVHLSPFNRQKDPDPLPALPRAMSICEMRTWNTVAGLFPVSKGTTACMPLIRLKWLESACGMNIDEFEAWVQNPTPQMSTLVLNLYTHSIFEDPRSPSPDLTTNINFFAPAPIPAAPIVKLDTDYKSAFLRRMWDEKLQCQREETAAATVLDEQHDSADIDEANDSTQTQPGLRSGNYSSTGSVTTCVAKSEPITNDHPNSGPIARMHEVTPTPNPIAASGEDDSHNLEQRPASSDTGRVWYNLVTASPGLWRAGSYMNIEFVADTADELNRRWWDAMRRLPKSVRHVVFMDTELPHSQHLKTLAMRLHSRVLMATKRKGDVEAI